MPIHILVVEDHPVVRLGIKMLLDGQPDMDIIAEASTAAEAVWLTEHHQPDIVLVDIGLPDGSGIDTTEEIKRKFPQTNVVALTIHEDHEYVERMLAVGARGYVPKHAAPNELLTAIREVAQGEIYLHPALKP